MNDKHHWQIDPSLLFLNHGCFGALPREVAKVQSRLRDMMECDPINFLAPERELEQKLDQVRQRLGQFVGADAENLVFVRNSTDGVNAVLQSMELAAGDELIVTNHGYNACNNVAHFIAEKSAAVVRIAEIDYPIQGADQVLNAVRAQLTSQTRFLLVDHVTSPTAIVFPVAELIELARGAGVKIMVDGAHASGMLPLQIEKLAPDYYTANHHKWLCAPKASGFLYVRPELQGSINPTVISHPYNTPRPDRSKFTASFDWNGTHDPTPILAVPAALDFLDSLNPDGVDGVMQSNHNALLTARDSLCKEMGIETPAPDSMLGSMLSLPLPRVQSEQAEALRKTLRSEYRIEVPVYGGIRDSRGESVGNTLLRVSVQAYNDPSEIEMLINALRELGAF